MAPVDRNSTPVPGSPGNTAKGQIRKDWAETTAQDCPSRASKRCRKATVKAAAREPLPTVTVAQVAAAQLRLQAMTLIRLAEQLEATVPPQPKRKGPGNTTKQIIEEMGLNV